MILTLCSSSGGNSLSIWTHHIRGIKTIKGDKRALTHGAVAAVKISAGMRMFELYAEMAKQNLTVMGGADGHVGIGGWISAAGHGPLTSIYGLGADQVLEMEVVTADGEYRVVNENSFPNLFWAMRGVRRSQLFKIMVLTFH
jgi:FAD/FMN-containing dehydrogenase